MFLTTVERVALNYNTPQQVELERLTLDEARQYLSEGQFLPGSMGPKIEAAVDLTCPQTIYGQPLWAHIISVVLFVVLRNYFKD